MKCKEYIFNNSTVRIIFGDIITSKAEVIVSSDDNYLTMGGGVSKVILKAGGSDISHDASKLAPAQLGDALVTTAGNLPQKYIFHTVTLGTTLNGIDHNTDVQTYIITHSIKRCFQHLRNLNLTSIAFPCIGAGLARIPYEKVAKCMAKAISRALMSTSKSLSVEIYLLDRYESMTDFEFLPFFEWFAAYSHLAKKEIEAEENTAQDPSIDSTEIEIIDTAGISGKIADIFISYSRKDAKMAKLICGILNEMHISYWIDVDGIYSGNNFKETIVKAINQSKIVLFLSSENSNQSPNVAKEIGIADKYNKIIIPVRLDCSPFNPKLDYDLSGIDAIDFSNVDEKSINKIKNAVLGQIAMSKI